MAHKSNKGCMTSVGVGPEIMEEFEKTCKKLDITKSQVLRKKIKEFIKENKQNEK